MVIKLLYEAYLCTVSAHTSTENSESVEWAFFNPQILIHLEVSE